MWTVLSGERKEAFLVFPSYYANLQFANMIKLDFSILKTTETQMETNRKST